MNWMIVLWPMVAGACLTMALMHLRIAFGDGRRAPHFFFALAAMAVAVISGFELTLLQTNDLAAYQTFLRWAVVPIGIMIASVIGFVWSFFGTGNRWLALSAVGLNLVAQAANLLSPEPVVRRAVALQQVPTFGGVSFTVPTIINGSWNLVDLTSVVLALIFVVDASVRLWRRGNQRRALIVGGGIVFFLFVSRGHAVLVEKGMLQTPYFVSFAFLGVIIAMGHELSADVLRAATLARQLRESEHRADLAAQAAALGFWRWDVRSDEFWATANAHAIFQVPPERTLNMREFLALVHPENRDAVQAAIQKALNGDGYYQAEYRILLPGGGARWIAAHGRTDFDLDHKPVMLSGAVMDITGRRDAELELQQLRGQLAHAGRVSVMGQLAAAMAHELNQPLGAILSNAEAAELLLRQNPPPMDEVRDILVDIRRDDERAGEVIRRMRALLQRHEMERRPLMINSLIEEVFRLVSADATFRRINLCLKLAPSLPALAGDRIHLQQVFLNLILNALEAISKNPNGRREVILISQLASGAEAVEVAVADSGPGIDPAILARLFEPFFTTKPNGMGMGLAISQRIIEAHGGRITAGNQPVGGAIFHVVLPVPTGEQKA